MKLAEEPCPEEACEVTHSQGVPLIDFGMGASGGVPMSGQPLQGLSIHQPQPPIGFNVMHPGFLPPSSPLPPPIPAQPPVTEKSEHFTPSHPANPGSVSNPTNSDFMTEGTPTAPSKTAVAPFDSSPPPNYDSIVRPSMTSNNQGTNGSPVVNTYRPTPAPRNNSVRPDDPSMPELPEVPDDSPGHTSNGSVDKSSNNEKKEDDIDFDDLAKRFEALKKRK